MTLLGDLYAHQAWADAELWSALAAHGTAWEDARLRERQHHIHLVQHAFLAVVGSLDVPSVIRRRLEEFETPAALMGWAQEFHAAAVPLVEGLPQAERQSMVTIPWFKDPPCRITREQALTQAAMHSHYHRAQNATRLRELGGEPPLTDLIVWYWKDRPRPRWPHA